MPIISFEDLANQHLDPQGNITDAGGPIANGYCGFNWSSSLNWNQNSSSPNWASLEWFMMMQGVDHLAYMYTGKFSMVKTSGYFDLLSMKVGSYFYDGQDVYAAGLRNGKLIYNTAFIVGAMVASPVCLSFLKINHFALWSGKFGTHIDPSAPTEHTLCIDGISYKASRSLRAKRPEAFRANLKKLHNRLGS